MRSIFRQIVSYSLALIFSFCFISNAFAIRNQDQKSGIIGMWQTTLEENGSELVFVLKFETTDTDSIKCTIHWPEMGMSNIPYANFVMKEDSIILPKFKAILSLNKIVGQLSVMGPELDVELRKIDKKPTFSVDCPEKEAGWIFDSKGAIWSHPIIHNDQLLFGNDEGTFYSINLMDKLLQWTFQTEGKIKSGAIVMCDAVSFAGDDGNLYSLDLESGKVKWKLDIGNSISPRIEPAKDAYDYDYLCSSPIQSAGMIYIGSKDSCLYAVDAGNGEVKWKYKTNGMIRSTPALDRETIYVGSWDHYMYALNKDDGSLKWKYKTGWSIQSSPLVVDDKVVFGSRSAQVFAVDKTSGKEVWMTRYWGSWVESSPILFDGKIYIGSSDFRKVFALDPTTGKVLMSTLVEGWSWATPAVSQKFVFTGTVGSLYYMEAMHGRFYAFDRITGKPAWQLKTEDDPDIFAYGFASSPAIWKDWVFVGGLDGRMYGMKVKLD